MADRTVRAIIEAVYEGARNIRQARDDLREVDDAAREAGDGLRETSTGFSKAATAAATVGAGLIAAKVAYEGVKQAAQQAYAVLREGADLQYAAQQFDGLTESIGTTADALQSDLQEATRGMVSNAELVQSANEIMQRGLASSHDEVVRMSAVAGQLGWDMEALGLTIANETTMRLDTLGLSAEAVTRRWNELKDAGMASQEALKLAVLEAGEEKLLIYGDRAETAAGQMDMLEASTANAMDAAKMASVQFFAAAGGIEAMSNAAANLNTLTQAMEQIGEYKDAGLNVERLQWALANGNWEEVRRQLQILDAQLELNANSWGSWAFAVNNSIIDTGKASVAVKDWGDSMKDSWRIAMSGYGEIPELPSAPDPDGYWSYFNIEPDTAGWEQIVAQMDLASQAADQYAQRIEALNALGGDYFTQFSDEGSFDFAQQLYETADAAGAPLGPLRELAVAYGLMTEAEADAATSAAQTQVIMDSIAAAVSNGVIAWNEYAAAVEAAQQVINGDLTIPEISDLGDYGYSSYTAAQEAEREGFELKIGADITAVEQAVADAEGIVTGFVSPDSVYEAVMELNIESVRAGATEATDLIVGIPNEKTVTINFQATGTQILEELRAIGAIP